MTDDLVRSDFSRMFVMKGDSGPSIVPQYQGLWKAGALTWNQGDITLIYVPDPNRYGAFIVNSKFQGEPSNPEMAVLARYTFDLSEMLRIIGSTCDNELQIHMGDCQNPQDFNAGWRKVLVLESAKISTYGTGDLGALQPDQRNPVDEDVSFVGTKAYEIGRLTFARKATADTDTEVMDVFFCAGNICESCSAEGKWIFAVLRPDTYAAPDVVFSSDGGLTWSSDNVDSAAPDNFFPAGTCVGDYIVLLNYTESGIEYCDASDLINGVETWTSIVTGFVAGGPPNAVFSASPTYTWIVGDGGYIYLMSRPGDGVTVQDAGSATTEDLNSVHALSITRVISVGDNNAVVYTVNGGATWAARTGPNPGVNLTAQWMRDDDVWMVGDATGRLWYTLNGGVTWYEKTFVGSGTGAISDIVFVTNSVGYMTVNIGGVGRLYRTIDGGYSWYVLPEGTGTIPTNTGLNAIGVYEDANIVYAAGKYGVADGIIISGAT